jgi:hypothetical protein
MSALPAFNEPGASYFSQTRPYLREEKHTSGWSGDPGEQSAAGYLAGVANGQVRAINIYQGAVEHGWTEANIPVGDYSLKWGGVGWDLEILSVTGLTVSGGGYGLQGAGSRHFKFRITDSNIQGFITIRATNNSGAAADLTDYRCFRVTNADGSATGYEALINAGEIFKPEFVSAFDFVTLVRYMNGAETNALGYALSLSSVSFANYRAETDASWARGSSTASPALGQAVPPSIAAKFAAKKTGRDLWFAVTNKATVACMTAIAQAIKGVSEFTGKVYVEYGNEGVWNFADQATYLQNVKFAGLDPDGTGSALTAYDSNGNVVGSPSARDKAEAASAHGSLQCWKAFEDVLGRSRVVRVLSGQAASFASSIAGALQYIDPGIISAGARLYNLVDKGACAPYWEMRATASIPAVNAKALCTSKAYNLSDAAWVESYESYIDNFNAPNMASWKSSLAALNPAIGLITYECGNSDASNIRAEADSEAYSFTSDTVNNKLVSGSDISGSFDTGEALYAQFGLQTLVSTLSGQGPIYCRRTNTTDLKLYPTAADAIANTNIYTIDGAGTFKFDNYTRLLALEAKRNSIMDGPLGRALGQHYKASVFDQNGVEIINWFHVAGDRQLGANWGMKPTIYSADNELFAWFRSLEPPPPAPAAIVPRSSLKIWQHASA